MQFQMRPNEPQDWSSKSSMCYVVGRAVATGFRPEAAARHMVITKPQGHSMCILTFHVGTIQLLIPNCVVCQAEAAVAVRKLDYLNIYSLVVTISPVFLSHLFGMRQPQVDFHVFNNLCSWVFNFSRR